MIFRYLEREPRIKQQFRISKCHNGNIGEMERFLKLTDILELFFLLVLLSGSLSVHF